MQGQNECGRCGKDFDTVNLKPMQLPCDHILCSSCVLELYMQNQHIKCPWDGQITEGNPMLLPVYQFKLEPQQLKFTECQEHIGNLNTMYDRTYKSTICVSCAPCTKQPKRLDIVDIKEEIENLNANEVVLSKMKFEKIAEFVAKNELQLEEQNQKQQKQTENYIQSVEKLGQEIIQFLSEQKQQQINNLIQKQSEYQQWHDQNLFITNQIKNLLEKVKIEDESNIGEFLDFIGKAEGLEMQILELKGRNVEIEHKVNQNSIEYLKQTIIEIFQFQYQDQEVKSDFQAQIKEYQIQLEKKQIKARWQENLKSLSTFEYASQNKKDFELTLKQFKTEKTDIQKTEFNCTQVEQIGELELVISGGNSQNQRFDIFNRGNVQKFNMNFGRYFHRTVFDANSQIYIISGYNQQYIKECEVFDLQSNQFIRINDISFPTRLFGAFMDETKNIFVTGGDSASGYLNKIQVYDQTNNQWTLHNCQLPKFACSTAAYIYNTNAGLVYYNGNSIDTLIFDFRQITRHGDQLNCTTCVFTQPITIDLNVYQFGCSPDLFIYPLNQAKWELIV